ncbi:vacuolar protein sorting-associated protein 72 homolog [Paramacrobiotus metropolitanus]|uniref:vacuolar protein sorting-associated protein 72 homolog n=1 Tax=Paramacrobiotus metropolitanus TaxID=2943436 RepID=UPI0024460070|nr:vacuolar protein sorting-associated protein 72 homolog [Paramacrobiotus metropolitanus]
MAASRAKRINAGALMPGLIKDFHEDEVYKTLYEGFDEKSDDEDFGLEALSDNGSDVDFDEEEEDLEDDIQEGQEEDEDAKKRRRPAKKPWLRAKRKAVVEKTAPPVKKRRGARDDEDTRISDEESDEEAPLTPIEGEDTSSGDKDDSHGMGPSTPADAKKRKKPTVMPSGRSIRDSTAAKRFAAEELELQRELRRQEIGPRKKTKYRIPTQAERLAKCVETEKKNRADLAKYQKDEEENEKKKAKKQKVVRGPFDICSISTTVQLPRVEEISDKSIQALLLEAESLTGNKPGERYARSAVCFRTEDDFHRAFPVPTESLHAPAPRTCLITGKPARYRDPVTMRYYYDSQALHALRGLIYRHLLMQASHLQNGHLTEYVQWYESRYKAAARNADEAEPPVNGTAVGQ